MDAEVTRIVDTTRQFLNSVIQRMPPREYLHYLEVCVSYGTPDADLPCLTYDQFHLKEQFLNQRKQQNPRLQIHPSLGHR